MKPPVINMPENYMISAFSLSQPNAEDWEIWDTNIPNTRRDTGKFPYRSVARVTQNGVWYWPVNGGLGDFVKCESLDAAVKHFETMVGLGLVGHGYTKGMLNETN